MALQWIDFEDSSTLAGSELDGCSPYLWLDKREHWASNTPPLGGAWLTREEAKNAIQYVLRRKALEVIDALDVLESASAVRR